MPEMAARHGAPRVKADAVSSLARGERSPGRAPFINAALAQLAEQSPCKRRVIGSNPLGGSARQCQA